MSRLTKIKFTAWKDGEDSSRSKLYTSMVKKYCPSGYSFTVVNALNEFEYTLTKN